MTVTAFTPSAFQLFHFQATLDGGLYTCTTTWNVYRQRWYLNVTSQANTLIVATPLVGSPPAPSPSINLVAGYFTASTLVFYEDSQTFVVTP